MSIDATHRPVWCGGCQCGAVHYTLRAGPTKLGVCDTMGAGRAAAVVSFQHSDLRTGR